jgi:hypothetical protein
MIYPPIQGWILYIHQHASIYKPISSFLTDLQNYSNIIDGGAGYSFIYNYLTNSIVQTYNLAELDIYGNKRVGTVNPGLQLYTNTFTGTVSPDGKTDPIYILAPYAAPGIDASKTKLQLGNKSYELSNHLGNVLVTISDRKIPHSTGRVTRIFYTLLSLCFLCNCNYSDRENNKNTGYNNMKDFKISSSRSIAVPFQIFNKIKLNSAEANWNDLIRNNDITKLAYICDFLINSISIDYDSVLSSDQFKTMYTFNQNIDFANRMKLYFNATIKDLRENKDFIQAVVSNKNGFKMISNDRLTFLEEMWVKKYALYDFNFSWFVPYNYYFTKDVWAFISEIPFESLNDPLNDRNKLYYSSMMDNQVEEYNFSLSEYFLKDIRSNYLKREKDVSFTKLEPNKVTLIKFIVEKSIDPNFLIVFNSK